MKLENIKVCARLRESPSALFKVNKLSLSEDEKSILISSLNGNFDACFGKFSQYPEVLKGMECPKYLKQLLHGYNAAVLSFGVGESEGPGARAEFLLENLETLENLMEQNSYRYNFTISFTIFGVSDGQCLNLLNFKKFDSLEISEFLQDFEVMEEIENLGRIKEIIRKGYSLPILVFVHLKTESKQTTEIVYGSKPAANVSVLCLADLGSLSNPKMEKSLLHMKSTILTMDQTFISGELKFKDFPLTHLLSPFLGGNSHTLVLLEISTNSSFQSVSDSFLFGESLRRIKNRIDQVFENFLVEQVDDLWEKNESISKEKNLIENKMKDLNSSMSRLLSDQATLKGERDLLTIDNEAQKFLLDYNLSRVEVEKLEVKEKIRFLRIEMVQLDHQRALKSCQAFNEAIGRRKAEFELLKALKIARESENNFGGQIGSLRERISHASEELQRSVEERSIMQSKLQMAQNRIDSLNLQLREVELSRSQLEGQKFDDTKLERIKGELEIEIQGMRRQLEKAKQNEKNLSETVNRAEGRGDESRREIVELERELRILRSENNLLQVKLKNSVKVKVENEEDVKTIIPSIQSNNKRNNQRPTVPTAGYSSYSTSTSASSAVFNAINVPSITVPNSKVNVNDFSIPTTNSHNNNNNLNNKSIPIEIAAESPIVRRGKRNSMGTNKAEVKVEESLDDEIGVKTPTGKKAKNSYLKPNSLEDQDKARYKTIDSSKDQNQHEEEKEKEKVSVSISKSLLEGIGRKKIKLPERFKGNNSNFNTNNSASTANQISLQIPITPQSQIIQQQHQQQSAIPLVNIPRSTPLGKTVDPGVMESIMSSFTVKIPTIKK